MTDSLTIDEVVRRTGLTARALRFYEGRALIAPLRTASGRRLYPPAALERLHQVTVLKRAGFTLAAIQRLLGGRAIDPAAALRVQLQAIEAQRADLAHAAETIRHALSRIDDGERLDAATLCSLIQEGDTLMTKKQRWDEMKQQWEDLSGSYLSDEAKRDFTAAPYPEGFDQAAYTAQWEALGAKVRAALPLDPASPAAQALLDEWQALLAPFTAIATPAMADSVKRMYDDMPNWSAGAPSPGFDHGVWQFIMAASAARKAAG